MSRDKLYENDNMALFDDGTIGMSDGVGFIGSLNLEEVKELYEALKKYFEKDNMSEKEYQDLMQEVKEQNK